MTQAIVEERRTIRDIWRQRVYASLTRQCGEKHSFPDIWLGYKQANRNFLEAKKKARKNIFNIDEDE